MLIHANRDELLRLSKQVALAVPETTEIIDLRGIHMEADARRSMLTLTATNQEIAIQTSMSAVVEQAGSIVIDAKLLPSLLSRLPEETLDIELGDNGQLTVCSGTARYRLGVSSGEKYPMPELPFPDDTVPVTGLRSLVRQTAFATLESTSAPLMSCIKVALGPDGLKGVSTNRFCVVEARGDKNCRGQSELLIPARSLAVLAAVSSDKDVYEMGLTGKSIVFWNGTLLFSARLMEGKYPNTGALLTNFQGKYSVNLAAEALESAIASVSVMGAEGFRVALSFGEHELHVSAETAQGRAAIPVKALVLNAPDRTFYYNYKILLKYLRLVSGNVTLDFDANGLLAIRAGGTQYIQSPLRAPNQAAGQSQNAA